MSTRNTEFACLLAVTLLAGLPGCGGSSTGTPASDEIVAPTISQHPASLTVASGSTATFSVTATGTGTLSYQWLRNGTAINGATTSSHVTTGLTTADSGAQFAVTVSNSAGSRTSNAATVTVTSSTVSELASRAWTAPLLIEAAGATVREFVNIPSFDLGVADSGLAVVAFTQDLASGRHALQVTEGRPRTPTGTDPAWTTPVVLDATAPVFAGADGAAAPRVAVSPNGFAVVVWQNEGVCTDTGAQGCKYIYSSHKWGEGPWQAPVLVSRSAFNYGGFRVQINDRGNTAILFDNGGRPGIALRTGAAETAYRVETLQDWTLGGSFTSQRLHEQIVLGLDRAGGVHVTGLRDFNVISYRGTVAGGFGITPQPVELESRSTAASLVGVATGVDGHAAVVWQQDTATTRDAVLMAVYSPTAGAWTPAAAPLDLTSMLPSFGRFASTTTGPRLGITDDGEVQLYERCRMVAWKAGALQPLKDLPANCGLHTNLNEGQVIWARNGNYLVINDLESAGFWVTYDASENRIIQAAPATLADIRPSHYIFGTPSGAAGAFPAWRALTPGGQAVVVIQNRYTAMPSASTPLGDLAPSGSPTNLWGMYLK